MTTESLNHNLKEENEGISLREIILKIRDLYRYLLVNWIKIILAILLGAAIGLVYTYLKKTTYTAASTFVLEDGGGSGGGLGQYAGIASMVGIDVGAGGGGIFQGDNIIELYKSRTMIEETLLSPSKRDSNILLIDSYINFNHLRDRWKNKPDLSAIQFKVSAGSRFSRLQDSILGDVVNNINKYYLSVAKLDKKLSIIKVIVSAPNESFAKDFNDQIVKNVNDFYVRTKTKKSMENVAILQQKTDSVRGVMNGAIYSAAVVADATPNLNPTRQVQRSVPIQRSQFSIETNKTVLGELVKNLELSKISLRKETPLIQIVDEPIFPLDNDKPSRVKFIVLGGMAFGLLAAIYLLLAKAIKDLLKD
ncbi:Wzz/FepE/Etk N-terminal domain-containing protein [Pedobacter caeni]|uniref:Chain length determinant protein n=1 Tax=Pedobacter caeni TaxID=288992 RepID=A0A1M5PPP3_9SPHI|nr:Wzz/FepE/Etk N-terminal domain-containing protein [Pedobacter caeni]SHH03681.1 Chain length determinant protein [Pedobacter caeni]